MRLYAVLLWDEDRNFIGIESLVDSMAEAEEKCSAFNDDGNIRATWTTAFYGEEEE